MENIEVQERDFNLFAKIFLGISIVTTLIGIFNCLLSLGISEYLATDTTVVIIEIVLDILIVIAGLATFFKSKWGLIALSLLFTVRMFATIPLDSNMYSYKLGINMAHFIRDFGLFAISMCFKKNGVSGWRAMLSSKIKDIISTTEDSNIESVIEQDCIDDDTKETSDRIQEEEVLPQNTTRDDEVDAIEEHSPVITNPVVENKKEVGAVETKKVNSPKQKKYRGLVILIILSLIFVGSGIGLIAYVNSQEYPKSIEGLSNKFKYCFSIPNNKLAKIYFEKYRKASNAGLDDLSLEFLEATWDAKSNNDEILDSIGSAYFDIAHCEDKTLSRNYYKKAERAVMEGLKANPQNRHLVKLLAKIYYNTDQNTKAKKIVEQILFENPGDDLAINLMCRIYYERYDWDNLLRWGERGYKLGCDKQYRVDCVYLYSKGLYETGNKFDAMKYYAEAERKDPYHGLHATFEELGGIPCTILSLSVSNEGKDGTIIAEPGEAIYKENACHLIPYIKIKSQRKGTFNLDVKLYHNGHLKGNKNNTGYTYSQEVRILGLEEQTIEGICLASDSWDKGTYRFEIWWKGNKLHSQSFKIH